MAIEIVSFPMKNGGSFHSYVEVYQRVMIERRNGAMLVVNVGWCLSLTGTEWNLHEFTKHATVSTDQLDTN